MARRSPHIRPSRNSPYGGNRVGHIPLGRKPATGGSHAGEYRRPPNGPGPGQGPYPWKAAPAIDAVDFSGPGWVDCDSTSHLAQIRFVHSIDQGELSLDSDRVYSSEPGVSYLQVKFRDGGWASYWSVPGTQFSADRLEAIYLQMESDINPGEIIWYSLIGVGGSVSWPYDTSA